MTKRTKDKIISTLISLCLLLVGMGVGRITDKKDQVKNELKEKLETDIAILIKEDLKPEFNKKLDKAIFEEHVKSQDKQYEALITLIKDLNEEQNKKLNIVVEFVRSKKY